MLDCSKAEALGVLNFLWFWGLNNADENGRIEDADKGDVAEVFYGKTEIPPEKVVSALFSSGWLDDVGGIIYLHDWSEWQEQWYKFRRKRDYDARRKRDERAKNRKDPQAGQPPQQAPPEPEAEGEPAGGTPPPPAEGDPQEGQQPVKRKKPKRETVRMAEFVHLTEAEYRQELQDNDKGDWSEEAREWATKVGLFAGNGSDINGEPNYMWQDFLTREQAAQLFYRFAKNNGLV